jgi:hypothetical protein
MLDGGYRRLVDKWLFAQLAYVRDIVDRRSAEYATVEAVLALLRRFSADTILNHSTPFLWLNVIRLNILAGGRVNDFRTALNGLAITVADCFLGKCPEGTEFAPGLSWRQEGYCFPATGIRVYLGPNSRLRHSGGGSLTVIGENSIAGDQSSQGVTIKIRGYPDSNLIFSNDPELFEDGYRQQISPNARTANALAEMIEASLHTIGRSGPSLLARINSLVRWYVPINSPDILIHNSFSASTLFGVVFLSDAYSSIRLAEAIVHEFHHNELYMLMAVEELFEEIRGELFYSPWRDDPRPLSGLIHGLHVFANVKRFLLRALNNLDVEGVAMEIRERCARLTWQIRVGLQQIPIEQIKPSGMCIIDDVRSVIDSEPTEFSAPPDAVRRHMERWQHDHPELRVRDLCIAQRNH